MFSAGRSFYDLSSICDNSRDKLSSYSEEGFSTFSFCDLILPLTPCLNENLIEMPLKLPPPPQIEMFPTDKMLKDQLPDVSEEEEEDFSALSPSLARLSPGIEDRKLFLGEDWLLDFPQASTEGFHLSGLTAEDFDELKSPAGNLDSSEEVKFEFLLKLVGGGSGEEVVNSDEDCYQDTVDWLTKTTIAPDHLDLTATSECVEAVVGEEKKQVLQEILIPSTVPDTFPCDAEVTSSKGEARKVVKTLPPSSSTTKGRKRSRPNLEPGTEEYKKKRELNNISVRKSREKARQKQHETEERADLLVAENDRLQARVDSLEKELTILRGLFTNIGATLPTEINTLLPAE